MEEPLSTERLLLDGVNILLESINELGIEDEEDYQYILEARKAKNTLIEVKRAVLSEGWDVNTDNAWVFSPTTDGEIPIPTNVLDIAGTNDANVINRNWRLYSKDDMTHTFTDDVTCKVIWDMDFNSLSHPMRHYITIRASRVFQTRQIGDREMKLISEDEELKALHALRRSEGRTKQFNILTSSYGTDNRIRTS